MQFWAKITGRAYVRGGRDHFTEIKFNEIRSRCAEFGELLPKSYVLKGFSSFVFSSYFQKLLKVLIFVEFGLIILLFINIFFNF